MAATAAASTVFPTVASGGGDLEDSNISSPLSEVDDKDTNDEDIEHMHLDGEEGDNSSISVEENLAANNDGSDSDSALSDAVSDVNSEANDTEAETLRLYDTPQAPRHRDVASNQFHEIDEFEHTPSKLRMTSLNGDGESASGDEASVISSPADGDESPAKAVTTHDTSPNDDTKPPSQDRKRKRSTAAEQSDPEQPLRKRTSSMTAANNSVDDGVATIEDDAASAFPQSGLQSPGEDEEASSTNRDIALEDEALEADTLVTKKTTRRNSKRKTPSVDGQEDGVHGEIQDEPRDTPLEDIERPEEEAEVEAEEETDAVTKNIEELERKQAAYRDWTHIEEMFGIFRDRLYKDRLQKLEEEEQSLHAAQPTHPEYLNMKQCLDDRLNEKLQAIKTEHEFRIKAHDRRAVAQRAQIWGQYFQAVRERREQALEALNKQWYDVQSARRSAHSLPDYGLLFPKDPSQRIRNAIAYNSEVSTLSGLAKYEGFPAGPELQGASMSELDADLAAMERPRQARHKPSISNVREGYQPPHLTRLDPAGEQFLKDTPWANPNHSAHKVFYYQPSQAEGKPDQPSVAGRTTNQVLPPPTELKAMVDGPAPGRSPALHMGLPESSDIARTVLTPSAHPMKRVGSIPGLSRGPKTATT